MTRATLAAAVLLGALLGCESPGAGPTGVASSAPVAPPASAVASAREGPPASRPAPSREGSVIARSPESDALYVADEDRSMVRVLALPAQVRATRADVQAPGRPAQVLVTRDRVLVTIRKVDAGAGGGEGALLVLQRKPGLELSEVGRVPLPPDAWGIAITPDEGTAIVSSAWTHKLSAVDLKALKVIWSVDVAREPRGIVVLPGGDRAYVSHLVGSEVTRVDGLTAKEPRVTRIKLPASPMRSPYGVELPASLGYAAVASPSGDRVYFPRHALGALGPDAWFGAGAVDVLLTADDTPLAPPRSARPTARFVAGVAATFDKQPWMTGANPAIDTMPSVHEPRAVVYRRTTDTILIANEGSNSVSELDALAMDPTLSGSHDYPVGRNHDPILHVPQHGGAPSGLVLSEAEDEAYVFCRSTDDIVILRLPPDRGYYRVAPPIGIPLGEPETKQLATGRALFYDGGNGFLSGGLSCAACHPEGRDDGHVWHEVTFTSVAQSEGAAFTNFFAATDLSSITARWGAVKFEGEGGFGYARQTPMLAGRVSAAGPYGWHGESVDLPARILAGFGLHRWLRTDTSDSMSRALVGYLATFVREGLVPPPRAERPLTEEEERGKKLFESPATQCSTCHVPATGYTDRIAVSLKKLKPPAGFADDPNPAFKTPSLLFVGGTPPYMHDGRFETLESLFEYNLDRMGKTAQLSPDERKALIAFLRTL
jgi:DNA-binding beta-propeller fold protein YncE/mono/diheme cytochrome c family protein